MKLDKYDRTFSIYIRLRDRIPGTELIKCCCCGKIVPWLKSDNAHYVSRANMATRFDEHNCHACCQDCNRLLDGNLEKYRAFLVKKYRKEVELIESKRFKIVKFSKSELDDMLYFWKEQIKEMTK